MTQDISGGGFSFIRTSHAEPGSLLAGTLELTATTHQPYTPFSGRIVRCEEKPGHLYKISVEFVHMDESARSDIIRFCRLKHAEQRSKWRNYSI